MNGEPNGTGCEPGFCRIAAETVIHFRLRPGGTAPLVFVHGFAATNSTWDDLLPLIPRDRYRLYLVDLIGSGLSSRPSSGYAVADQARVLGAFLESQKITGATIVGHSLGGTVSLVAALQHAAAQRISRLVLIGTPAFPQRLPRFFRLLARPGVGLVLRILPVRFVVRRSLATVYADPSLIDELRIARYIPSFRGRGTIPALVETVRRIVPEKPEEIIQAYRSLDLATLLIWGAEDRVVRPSQGEKLAGEIPGARLELVEKCGHNPHEERPEETWRLISRFLEEGASPPRRP